MMISSKGRYAMRLMIDLAQHIGQGNIPLKEISARQNVSMKYLEAIARRLSADGLIEAHHGKFGGYTLAGHPADVSVGDILRSAEDQLMPVDCGPDDLSSEYVSDCLTYPLWQHLEDTIYDYIDSVSLDDVIHGRT